MGLTSFNLTRVRPVVDESSLERMPGAQINWAAITADADGAKRVKAGTVVSRRSDGLVEPRSFSKTLTSVVVNTNVATVTLVGHGFVVGEQIYVSGANLASLVGGVLFENLLPDATGTPKVLPTQYKTELKNAGCTFKLVQYANSQAS